MKDVMNSTAAGRAVEPEDFGNRKLIRPSLSRNEHPPTERRERNSISKKMPPPEQTHAENFYYQKQMQAKTPMVVVLQDGEILEGVIEWYDKHCIKMNRSGGQPNVLIYKPNIKYMFKQSEDGTRTSG